MKYDFGLIAIGDELTDGETINTNTGIFAKHLIDKDFNVGLHLVCKDCFEDIISSLAFLKKNHTNIITIGGLGPTEDDITKQTIAKFFNKKNILDQKSWQVLQKKMIKRYGKITLGTKKQAVFPKSAQILINNNGTANGFKLKFHIDRYIYVFPGPPKECIPMLENLNLVNKQGEKIVRKKWQVYGIGESFLAEKLEGIKSEYSSVNFKYRITDDFIELKYFYPQRCFHSVSIIEKVEKLLKQYI